MPATKRRPAPRRPTITALVPSDQVPGRQVTIGEYIVEQIGAGVDPANAAGVSGVTPAEFQAWMREGVLVMNRLNAGAVWETDFTPLEQDAAVFAEQVVRARSAHIARLSIIAEKAARGGATRTTTRTRRVGGQVVEAVETVETMLPDLDMVKWKLEKLEPTVYGQKATLNLNVTDLTDTDSVADAMEARLREIAESLAAEYSPQPDTPADTPPADHGE